jgi:transcriptional regulator with XRE-family HTH domain
MNIVEYRSQIPWSRAELARQAGLDIHTVMQAESGGWITARTAAALVRALGRGLGRDDLTVSDIEGLQIKNITK